MKKIIITTMFLSVALLQAFDFGGFMDKMKDVVPEINEDKKTTPASIKALTNTTTDANASTVANGLKLALKKGVEHAVKELSKEGGYLNNPEVRIPLPNGLNNTERLIRKMGADEIADDFIESMNKAAAQSTLKATPIFVDAIEKMSIDDAKRILAGSENAATDYFKDHTTDDLKKMMKPIIQDTMEDNNVAQYYDTLNEYYDSSVKSFVENDSVRDMAANFGMEQYMPIGTNEEKLDDFVTRNAIDGLFKMIAKKEAEIRQNPILQNSELLQKVFGK